MKKIFLSFILIAVGISGALAQQSIYELKGGVLFPQDTETGTIIGLSVGHMADENLGWAFETQYFWRTYTQEYRTDQQTIVTEIENSTKMLPLMVKIMYLSQIAPSLDLRVSGGIGYAFLWNKEANYLIGVEESKSFSGFAWELGAGVSIPISRAADFFGELNYFYSTPSRDAGKTIEGLPQRTEIDMSGLVIRIGVRIYN